MVGLHVESMHELYHASIVHDFSSPLILMSNDCPMDQALELARGVPSEGQVERLWSWAWAAQTLAVLNNI